MSEPQTKTKSIPAPSINVDLEARTVTHWVTRPTLDEDCEVLLPRGADISRFSRSSTVFDVHDYGSKSVVGSAVPGSWKVSDEGVSCTTKFSPRPPENLWPKDEAWEPDRLLWLYHTGDIKGWSIGFVPLEGRNPTKKDLETWPECKWVHTRYRVLEYSVAPLPCNADCLTLAAKGILSRRLADSLAKGHRPARDAWDEPTPRNVLLTVDVRPDALKQMVLSRIAKPLPDEMMPVPAMKTVTIFVKVPAPAKRPVVDVDAVVRRAVAKARGKLYLD